MDPAQTLETVAPHLRDFGITRVADVTGMDCVGIPTVMVVRPNSRSVSVSQGKGVNLVTAKVSGIMESVEQFHAEHVLLSLRMANLREISGVGRVVRVDELPTFARRFNPADRILWVRGNDLVTNEEVWLPLEAVHLDLRLPLPSGSGYFLSGSNGLASGNHRLEAISHGLCELIERDALSLFLQSDVHYQTARRLDLETVDDPVALELLEKYARAKIDVALWDITSDLGVPCFLCWIVEATDDAFRPVGMAQGAGCHPTRTVALSRALTEAAQSRVTRIVGSRDDLHPSLVEELRSPEAVEIYRAQMARRTGDGRDFRSIASYDFGTFEEDIALLIERATANGVRELVGVNLSSPDYPVHVERVIAPGLEGPAYLPGYRPGARALQHRSRLEGGMAA